MRRIVGGVVALCLAMPVLAAEDTPNPEQQYKALLKEYQDGMADYRKALSAAKTPEERRKVSQERSPQLTKFVPKVLALAEKHPRDPVAVDALIWVVGNGRGGKDGPGAKALTTLLRDHITSPKLGPVCQRLGSPPDKASETSLRTVLEKNPHKEVQGSACFALAQLLKSRGMVAERVKGNSNLLAAYEKAYGKEFVEELKNFDPAKLTPEIETLLERAAKDAADVPLLRGTIGQRAKAELYEMRHLVVGKSAPDGEGEDQDGKKFKLSDYKGKVVLLDFWSEF